MRRQNLFTSLESAYSLFPFPAITVTMFQILSIGKGKIHLVWESGICSKLQQCNPINIFQFRSNYCRKRKTTFLWGKVSIVIMVTVLINNNSLVTHLVSTPFPSITHTFSSLVQILWSVVSAWKQWWVTWLVSVSGVLHQYEYGDHGGGVFFLNRWYTWEHFYMFANMFLPFLFSPMIWSSTLQPN